MDVPDNVRYLCVASDGLWEFMSNDEVLEIIHRHVGNDPTVLKGPPQALQWALAQANGELKDESEMRWMTEEQVVDDTSMVCALFNLP